MEIETKDNIIKELKEIQTVLETEMSEDSNEAIYRGNQLAVYMSRSGKLLADAKAHKDRKLKSDVVKEMKKIISLPASTGNKYVDSLCEHENYIVNWCERINRSCTHQIDWCRTLISKAKAEMSAYQSHQ